jgi:hypothetical protein
MAYLNCCLDSHLIVKSLRLALSWVEGDHFLLFLSFSV